MDADGTCLTSKGSDSAAESLCPMDVISPPQVQNMDTSQDNDATQLTSGENCSPHSGTTKNENCYKPVTAEPCQSIPTSTDVEMQSCVGDCRQRIEIGSQKEADSSDMHGEEECCVVQKGVDEENAAMCQSSDASQSGVLKTTEDRQETEALSTVAQPDANEVVLTDNSDQSLIESNAAGDYFASSTTTATSGKNISFSGHCSF